MSQIVRTKARVQSQALRIVQFMSCSNVFTVCNEAALQNFVSLFFLLLVIYALAEVTPF